MLTEKNIIVIGDVHGRTSWKQIVDKHPGCRLVFLGDYCDPYEKIPGEVVLENLMEIIRLKQAHPDDVILLLGNHDVHYYCDEAPIGTRYNLELGWEIEERFTMFAECFQCAYSERGILFTHAGVSDAWFHHDFEGDNAADVAAQLNARCTDRAIFHCGASRGGPHPHGGIYWAGKSEMNHPLRGVTQVVGHTRTDGVERIESGEGVVYFCDCLENGKYLMIEKNTSTLNSFYEMKIDSVQRVLMTRTAAPMHYHTSEKEFYVDGHLCPEPEESLEQLEAMYAEACEQFRSLPMEVSDEDFDEDDDEAISEGMARFNLCNYIDALEWKIDLKILHRYKG